MFYTVYQKYIGLLGATIISHKLSNDGGKNRNVRQFKFCFMISLEHNTTTTYNTTTNIVTVLIIYRFIDYQHEVTKFINLIRPSHGSVSNIRTDRHTDT